MRSYTNWFLLFVLLSVRPAFAASLTQPSSDTLHCSVDGRDVHLSWQIAFFAPIKGWIVERDGQYLAELPSASNDFLDEDAPAGEHHYTLSVINFDGSVNAIGECLAAVGNFGMRCSVEGREAHLEWGPILVDVFIERFDVYRNGILLESLPSETRAWTDHLPTAGVFRYNLRAVTGPEHDFLLGACTVRSPAEELVCHVSPPVVKLDWSGVPLPEFVIAFFVIVRDDIIVGATNALHFEDVPGSGVHAYQVFAVSGGLARDDVALSDLLNAYRIGECKIFMPGNRPPPPVDLVCSLVYALPAPLPEPVPFPVPIDTLANDGVDGDVAVAIAVPPEDGDVPPDLLPNPSVVLTWRNPIDYNHLIISRNGIQIAFLGGGTQDFIDEPPLYADHLVYDVVGVVLDRRSRATSCDVNVEPKLTPPPQNLFCEVLGRAVGPDDPGVVVPLAVDLGIDVQLEADELARFPVVRLTWSSPVPYLSVFVSRNQQAPVELPGTAMLYHDFHPPRGEISTYNVWAVSLRGVPSRRVRCDVFVPPLIVPPVHDLRCALLDTNAAGLVVALDWHNATRYDSILIRRDNAFLRTLPGDATRFVDRQPPQGVRWYEVIGQVGDRQSPSAECRVVVPGLPDNLLFFSNSLLHNTALDPAILPPEGNGRITCLASHRSGLQGWSFGVCSDPSVLVLDDVTLEGTKAGALNGGAGPSFLSIDRFAGGLTMAAIVDEAKPTSTLPPSASDSLLHVQYSPGPDAVPFGRYPVRYCETLGSPPVAVLYVVGGFELRPNTLQGTVVLPGPLPPFLLRGDVNGDEEVGMSDAVTLLNWLFLGGKTPGCAEQADINGSGEISLADAVYELQWEFAGGTPPPDPFPECGPDTATLGCEEPSCPQPIF